ncbi:MAG: tRNA threonylcarbamoyladenosine dehydratase [Anaerovoracaceae bacterium]
MTEVLSRTTRIIGEEGINLLKKSKVIVFGIGGVGGYIIEALARTGVGHIAIVDNDTVDKSNINRQIIALNSTIGLNKTDVMESRIKDIDATIVVEKINMFYLPEKNDKINFDKYDYIVDAIDTVAAKINIIEMAKKNGVKVISSMGTGNKMNPEMLEIADISKTSVCPLAKAIRKELRRRNIKDVKVLFSKEEPVVRANPPGSIAFVPAVAGLVIAGEVVKDLIKWEGKI